MVVVPGKSQFENDRFTRELIYKEDVGPQTSQDRRRIRPSMRALKIRYIAVREKTIIETRSIVAFIYSIMPNMLSTSFNRSNLVNLLVMQEI